jgi:hypothetical protein
MRIAIIVLCLSTGMAVAQTTPQADPGKDSKDQSGRTTIPEKKAPGQPQGNPAQLNTTPGGAPASGPQGEAPPKQADPKSPSKQ